MGIIEKMRLDGKKGFVTGAARGIGKCTATAFAEAGADVAIVDLDIEEAKKTAKELAEKTGRKVIAIQTDCTNKEQVDVAKISGTSDMKKVTDLKGNPLLLFVNAWSVGMVEDRNPDLVLTEFSK